MQRLWKSISDCLAEFIEDFGLLGLIIIVGIAISLISEIIKSFK